MLLTVGTTATSWLEPLTAAKLAPVTLPVVVGTNIQPLVAKPPVLAAPVSVRPVNLAVGNGRYSVLPAAARAMVPLVTFRFSVPAAVLRVVIALAPVPMV